MAQPTIRDFADSASPMVPNRVWSIGSTTTNLAAISISFVAFLVYSAGASRGLLFVAIGILGLVAAFHARFLLLAREQDRQTKELLVHKEHEFQSLFENALDAILVLDSTGVCRDANPSSWKLLSSHSEGIVGQPIRLFYSDPHNFDAMWSRLLAEQRFQGEAEFVRSDGATVIVEFTAAAHFLPNRHLMILRDITQRLRSQQAVNKILVLARSSWQEADALRRATLALTEDLRMDRVLDTLLETLARLVPYEHTQLLLLETGSRLFLARESTQIIKSSKGLGFPEALHIAEFPVLGRVLRNQDGLLMEDTFHEDDWRPTGKQSPVRSWMGVPIIASNQVLGILSLAHSSPARFSPDHLRLVRSLATPAAVAIQNARLYERAEIYGAELERRVAELHRVEQSLEASEEGRRASKDRFQKVFQSAPVAMSVTSLDEGRFIEVNETFERRFGFSRNELLGRTSTELAFWEDPQERGALLDRLRRYGRVRREVARLRLKSGLYEATVYSAVMIDFDGQRSLLVATEDLSDRPSTGYN